MLGTRPGHNFGQSCHTKGGFKHPGPTMRGRSWSVNSADNTLSIIPRKNAAAGGLLMVDLLHPLPQISFGDNARKFQPRPHVTHRLGDMAGISGKGLLGLFFRFHTKRGNIWTVTRSVRRQLVPADKPIHLLHLSSVWGDRQTQGYISGLLSNTSE